MPDGNASTPMTVGDLLEALLPPDIDPATPVWVERFDHERGPLGVVRVEYVHTANADGPGAHTTVIITLVVSD